MWMNLIIERVSKDSIYNLLSLGSHRKNKRKYNEDNKV